MNESNQPETRPQESELRYEVCRECRRKWNVSKQATVQPDGYLCPRCWSKYRNAEATKGAKNER